MGLDDLHSRMGDFSAILEAKDESGDRLAVLAIVSDSVAFRREGVVPVLVRSSAVATESGAVIAVECIIYDDPGRPLHVESFLNPEEEDQVELLRMLLRQSIMPVVILSPSGGVRGSIGVVLSDATKEGLRKALDESLKYNEEIRGKGGKIDFIRAKKEARKILTS